jgi:hypothetical protein
MRRFVILLLAVATSTGIAIAEAAGTGGTHYKTTLDATGGNPPGSPPHSQVFIEFGRVHSPALACKAGRSLQMIGNLAGGKHKVLDTGRSSNNGAYALVGNFTGSNGGTVKAARRVIGSGAHRKICDAGSVPTD